MAVAVVEHQPPHMVGAVGRCDLCGSRGHHTYRTVTIRLGPVLIVGHAATCCAATIGAKP